MAAPLQNDEYRIPRHHGPWTLDEWLDLPAGKPDIELVDGMLVISPVEAYQNRRLGRIIIRQLEDAAPDTLEVMPDCNVALRGDRGLIPDFAIIDIPGFEGIVLDARHHVLVGEISSPSTRTYDRTTKRALYAEAGIPFLMLVDPGNPPVAALLELRGDDYVAVARSNGGRVELQRPFPVMIDLGAVRPDGG